jgi:ABC-type transporter Mla maintaining outer membrane lipid asymmetry ATPase subunit MlaF
MEKIRLEEVSLSLAGKKIFENLNLVLNQGIHRVVSGQASGKSLFLQLLAGGLAPSTGRIFYGGVDVSAFCFEDWRELRLKIGYGFDYGGLLNNRSLEENLLLPLNYHNFFSPEESEERVLDFLEKFELGAVKSLRPSEVTGSQRKAAVVARALLLRPEVLVLDDPTTGLRNSVKESFFKELEREMHGGLSHLIYCSEDREMNERFKPALIDCHGEMSGKMLGETAA